MPEKKRSTIRTEELPKMPVCQDHQEEAERRGVGRAVARLESTVRGLDLYIGESCYLCDAESEGYDVEEEKHW